MNNAANNTKSYTVIVVNHPLFGTHERHAHTEKAARQFAYAAIIAGASQARICGPRGWL